MRKNKKCEAKEMVDSPIEESSGGPDEPAPASPDDRAGAGDDGEK
jgi:hypothetical protein